MQDRLIVVYETVSMHRHRHTMTSVHVERSRCESSHDKRRTTHPYCPAADVQLWAFAASRTSMRQVDDDVEMCWISGVCEDGHFGTRQAALILLESSPAMCFARLGTDAACLL